MKEKWYQRYTQSGWGDKVPIDQYGSRGWTIILNTLIVLFVISVIVFFVVIAGCNPLYCP